VERVVKSGWVVGREGERRSGGGKKEWWSGGKGRRSARWGRDEIDERCEGGRNIYYCSHYH
jgi:hypothetical protein